MNNARSVHVKCLLGIAREIEAMNLNGDIIVYLKKLPTERDVDITRDSIIVSFPEAAGEGVVGGTNNSNDIDYPCVVSFVHAADQALEIDEECDQWLEWRQRVIQKFHNRNPLGITGEEEVYICKVVPRVIIDMSAFLDKNLFAGALQINCRARLRPIP